MREVAEATLSNEDKNSLEAELTTLELATALKQMARNKSAGPDGLSADFYKVFFIKMKDMLLEAFNFAYEVKKLHISSREGLISLIPKKNHNIKQLPNWRPIILLCADYKILAKAISNRIKTHLTMLIGKEQSGFVPGRNISRNIRIAIDIEDYTERHDINALLLSLDFLKAFDRVEYQSLFKALKYFNFGDKIIKWIQLLFSEMKLYNTNNGFAGDPFTPTRGLFQGNPVSPTGFILIIELLAIKLRANSKIRGIKIGALEHLFSMFADDVDIYLSNSPQSCQSLINTIKTFEAISGLKVNYDKSTVYRLGSAKRSNAKDISLQKSIWSEGSVDILGFQLANTQKERIDLNIPPLLQKTKTILNIWKMRDLSLIRKVLICNSLISSLFTYKLSVLQTIPAEIVKEYENLIKNFIWGRKAKIPLKVLQCSKEDRGLTLTNIQKRDIALKVQWISKLETDKLLKTLAFEALENTMGDLIWEIQLQKEDIQHITKRNNFWVNVLESWSIFTFAPPASRDQVLNQIIWMNSNILIDNKPILIQSWFNKKLIRIKDLLDENDDLLSIKKN